MYISRPYLPTAPVTLAVSAFAPPGLEIISPPELKTLPPALRRHADLGLCPVGGNEVVCPPDTWEYYLRTLGMHGFSVIRGEQPLGSSYPGDTAYNVVVAGSFALLNPKACDKILLKILKNRYEILPVRQGYAKCSVAVVSNNAIITADAGIYRAVTARGLDALLISNNGVSLPPYENGFFGGATGLVAKDVLAINGSLAHMESGGEIMKFLESHGVRALELAPAPPFDTGSLIPLITTTDNIIGEQKQ